MNTLLRFLAGYVYAFVLMLIGNSIGWAVVCFLMWTAIPYDISGGLLRFYLLMSVFCGIWLMPKSK